MTTQPKRRRQQRAHERLTRRIKFLAGYPDQDKQVTDGDMTFVPADKLAKAEAELANLVKKGVK